MSFKNIILNIFLSLTIFFISCAESVNQDSITIEAKNNIVSGELVSFKYNTDNDYEYVQGFLVDENNFVIEEYERQKFNKEYIVRRIINVGLESYKRYSLQLDFINKTNVTSRIYPLQIQPSVSVISLCHTNECQTLTGNVLEKVSNIITIKTYRIAAKKIIYKINSPYTETVLIEHSYNTPVSEDYLDNILFEKIPEDVSFYIASITIQVFDDDNNLAETVFPVKVTRPLEIKHFGKYELAEVYEPIPVTGCIPGSVGNTVQYSESESETRQNSVSITINQSWSDSFSSNTSQTISEGISVGETLSTVNTSSMSNSETQSESFSNTTSESESNNISYSTNDGESWSWSLGESSSSTEGQTQTEGDNTNVSGSTTVGVSGEGSLPFLAKASGKVEVSAGISRGWNSSSSNSSSETNGESRGYTTSGSSQEGRTFGSVQNDSRSHSLSGAYILSSTTSNAISESSSLSSDRVWNMSESLSSGKVVTEGNSESISQTIVNSNSSTTTFSYSGYIPRGRYGVFFRQTSRYVKLSEIITYDLNGFPQHAGFIMMNSWAWAPELSIDNTCENAMISSLPIAECIIQPCGE